MDLLDPVRSDSPTATALVAALVVIHEGSALREALEAVERQVYGPEKVMVVGAASAAVREVAGAIPVVESVTEAIAALDPAITHVWLLHDDSIPRPDALGALVGEGARVGAALVGSKILKAGQPGMLESVGLATDVFEVPASGLDVQEHDQEQYDVLRDVAFVAGSSMLVDRALLDVTGGPDPRLEPVTAALDLCQRVRLAGGRVVVVPSAEVLHDGSCESETKHWRLEAGRIRSMLKAYSLVTLLWVVPFNFGLGLMEALVSPLFGRWRLFAFLRAWLWNLIRLPSTIAARRQVVREAGDDELFRFQVRGSARLTAFSQRVADRALRLSESERLRSLGRVVGTGQETVRRPVVAWLLGGVGFALIATRDLWADGVASVGYALTPPSSVSNAIAAVAGGWNPADLGSPAPLRPVVGAMSLVQVGLFGRASLALIVVLVAAAVAGVVGTARLLGPFGVRPAARYSAGVFLIGGPAVRVLAGDGVWHGIVAMAVLPWALAVVLHRERTASAVAAAALLTAIGAAFLPLMLLAPLIAILVWALVDPSRSPVLVQRALAGAVLAIPALLPWVGAVDDPAFVFTAGPDFYWSPSAWIVVAMVIVATAGLSAGDAALNRLTGWGALLAAGGALLARTGGFSWGTDPGAAGMAMAGVGMALVVGAGLETGGRWLDVHGAARGVRLVAALLASSLVVGTLTLAIPGRLGFPASGLSDVLSFTAES
ncbi:MAG: glycosyltransferase, partial [Acidimicrobiia bacterium]|nr:glycosyltransferase [Acidimicrobiia bacterium]